MHFLTNRLSKFLLALERNTFTYSCILQYFQKTFFSEKCKISIFLKRLLQLTLWSQQIKYNFHIQSPTEVFAKLAKIENIHITSASKCLNVRLSSALREQSTVGISADSSVSNGFVHGLLLFFQQMYLVFDNHEGNHSGPYPFCENVFQLSNGKAPSNSDSL